jgi:flagellar motor switch protein FliG
MFVFEDLKLLDARSMQRLLRDLETKLLAVALKATSEELKEKIFKNMSERGAAALKEEIEILGPVRVKDVEAAHGNIVKTARALQDQGEIVVERSTDDALIA